jgi:predicted  nucleic acid-binding Zn-ribbon protein
MTDDIHDISKVIGKLEAENTESQRQRDAMFKKLDRISDDITKLRGAVEMLAKEHADTATKVNDQIMPTVTEFQNLKQRGLGVIGFIALLGGGLGASILSMWQKFAA